MNDPAQTALEIFKLKSDIDDQLTLALEAIATGDDAAFLRCIEEAVYIGRELDRYIGKP